MPTSPRTHFPYPDADTAVWNETFQAMVDAIDASLYASREDRNIIMFGGSTCTFNSGTGVFT